MQKFQKDAMMKKCEITFLENWRDEEREIKMTSAAVKS